MSFLFFILAAISFLLVPRMIKNPSLGVFIILGTLPFERIPTYEAPIFGGITLKINQIIGLILICIFIYKILRKEIIFNLDKQAVLLSFYLLVSFVSIFGAGNIKRAILVWLFTVFVILVAFAISYLLKQEKDLVKLEKILFWTTMFVCIFGLLQFLGSTFGLPDGYVLLRDVYGDVTKIVLGFPRVQSFSLEPLFFANFLLLPFSLFFAKSLYKKESKNIFLLSLITVIFILTFSRGIYISGIAVVVILTGFGIYLKKFKNLFIVIFYFAVGVIIGAGLITLSSLYINKGLYRVESATKHATEISTDSVSIAERKVSWDAAIVAFKEKPILGLGIGNFGPWASGYPEVTPAGGWGVVNNETLEVLAETGIIGFLALTLSLLLLFWRGVLSFLKTENMIYKYWSAGLLITLFGIAIQYQSFSTLYIMHIWVAIGLLMFINRIVLNKYNS